MPNHTIFNERPESQDRALKVIEKLGYTIVPRSEAEKKRGSRRDVLFTEELQSFLSHQTYQFGTEDRFFSGGSIAKAMQTVDLFSAAGLYAENKAIYELLCAGKSMEEDLPDGTRQSFDLSFIDFEHLENNTFQVTDEFEVERPNGKFARPDIVILVNGIPLVVIECKKSSVDVEEGVKQNVRNWQPDYIPQLFKFTQLAIAMNPENVKYGTAGTTQEFYCKWHEEDVRWQEESAKRYVDDGHITEQDKVIVSMLSKQRLLNLIRFYILYDSGVKKVARYQQFFGVENTMRRIHGEDGCPNRGGVIWHTQGSGKSLTMVMLAKRIIADKTIVSPRFVLVCDRLNLIKQLRDNFVHTGMDPVEATTGRGLVSLLKDGANTLIATTINKFEAAAKSRARIQDDNIFLMID